MAGVVVVGGGLSGLAAAWAAARAGAGEVSVCESAPRPGGKVRTFREGPWLAELGPTAFLRGGEEAVTELLAGTGLLGRALPARRAAARRYVLLDGRPREIPLHPLRFLSAGILTLPGLLRLAAEPFLPRRQVAAEESVWGFAARRLGRQAADRLVAPMVLGIFAGDARRLSLPGAFPKLAALEKEHGSLFRGMLRLRRRGVGPAGVLTSFPEGLEALPAALARAPGVRFRARTPVRALERAGRRFRLRLASGETLAARAVILAVEAPAAARLLAPLAPEAAADLVAIPYPALAVVSLGYRADAASGLPLGFGVLVPRAAGLRLLGVLSESCLFPDRAPPGHRLLKLLYGGAVDPEAGGLPEGELLALAQAELRRAFGITAPPVFRRVHRWPEAIPQYELGHLARRERIRAALARVPGLFLAGTALDGIGCTKALLSGLEAGVRAARWLGAGRCS